ncbi:MAG: hypothetical protein EWV60_23135 [Microcystis sp. Msp_OC_L_20101000_S702]|uniref:ATP-dependent nuclease n=1 Tax=Microcystis sp. Msp_OC_L_20101000_S702 TaxID=2486218 RepID=UPI0011935CC1|nr:AAA family ATPase [Microcystis sp. Msp_OC_L_20101000_S702]TRU02995.1 MAG: hypothetical protein EWV60_23135 [Microcystis sp. Msp_OC_L_20101000_S702]
MFLRRLRLRDYRCFEDTDWIPLNRFSVFIGKNDGGKSSALHALKVILSNQPLEDADHRQTGIDEETDVPTRAAEISIELEVEHDELTSIIRAKRSLGGVTAFELQSELVADARLNQDLHGQTMPQLKELCTAVGIAAPGPQNRKDTFLNALTTHRDSLPTHVGWKPLPTALRQAFPICLSYDDSSAHDPESAVRTFASTFFKSEIQSEVIDATKDLRANVQQKINEKAAEIAAILKSECEEVESVEIPLAEDAFSDLKVLRIRVTKTDGTDVDWTRIGRGKKREMSLAVFRWQNKILAEHLDGAADAKPVVVLFDEPDINLDYQAQCKVTQSLEAMCSGDRCQAIVATHSHNLIDSVPIDSLVFFGPDVPDPSRRVWSYDSATDDLDYERVFLKALGVSNASFFNEKLFVCCSGETEIGAMPILFADRMHRSLSMSGVLLLNGFNDDGALDAAVILRKNKRRYVLIMDADMKAHRRCGAAVLQSKHGLEPQHVKYLGDNEFEDLFDDHTWAAALNELPQVEVDGEEPKVWTPDEIREMRNSPKFSAAVQGSAETVSLEGRSKPKLGVRVARKAIELGSVPDALVQALDYIAERATE